MTTPPAIERLAATVNDLRPDWNRTRILTALTDAAALRTPQQLVTDAIHAALDQDVKSPGAIPLHHASFAGDPCRQCATREATSPTAPRIVTCDKCGRQTEPNIEHACVPVGTSTKPPWWEDAKKIHDRYQALIKSARENGDHDHARDLAISRDRKLAALTGFH